MSRRIILCDGAEFARLWGRIGAGEDEVLTWIPRESESRARPRGFQALQGGLTAEAIEKLGAKEGDEFALVTDEAAFARSAVQALREAAPETPILLLSDKLESDDLPVHPCLLDTGLRTLIRDDIDDAFSNLSNLRAVSRLDDFEPRIPVEPGPLVLERARVLSLQLEVGGGRGRPIAPTEFDHIVLGEHT